MREIEPIVYPRAIYYGTKPPDTYYDINRTRFPAIIGSKAPFGETQLNPILTAQLAKEPPYPLHYILFANEDALESSVKIIPLPVRIPRSLSNRIINEMRRLQEEDVLVELRGGRKTDLIRPLRPEVKTKLRNECPNLVELITSVEDAIAGKDLYIRGIKIDEARVSTTQPDSDITKPNLHFDAERSSLQEYAEPVYQYYANIGYFPRQFRILPVPLSEMIFLLTQNNLLSEEEAAIVPVQTLLDRFTTHFSVPSEEIIVESGQLAIFDGRVFAHDAGKGRIGDLKRGRFMPTKEPDLLLALDSIKIPYYQGYYFPNLSFLEDTGTDAWWNLIDKVTTE